MIDFSGISDAELIERLKALVGRERAQLRAFLEHLREFRERKLAIKRSFPSVFIYCTQELGLSEGEAYRRMQASSIAARFPTLLDMLEDGRLNLTTVSLLAPHLNKANFEEVVSKVVGKSKRDVEFLLAGLAPKHEPKDSIRINWVSAPQPKEQHAAERAAPQPDPPPAPRIPDKVEPLTAQSARLGFTASRRLLDMIERARSLLRHKAPRGDLEVIFTEALEALLERRDPDRKGRPAPSKGVLPDRRRIPQWVKDAVWRRDSGRCAQVSQDGRRCAETAWLEYDHVTPYSRGGRSDDPDNIQLLCRPHNQLKAADIGTSP